MIARSKVAIGTEDGAFRHVTPGRAYGQGVGGVRIYAIELFSVVAVKLAEQDRACGQSSLCSRSCSCRTFLLTFRPPLVQGARDYAPIQRAEEAGLLDIAKGRAKECSKLVYLSCDTSGRIMCRLLV